MRRAASLLSAALLAGCATAQVSRDARAVPAVPEEIRAYYDYPHRPIHATVTVTRTAERWSESLIVFPLAAPDGLAPTEPEVEFEWFESAVPGRRPAIVFSPILGGDYPLERGFCRFFAARGYHVALVHRKTLKIKPEESIDSLEQRMRQAVLRVRQVVDWMAAHERVDAARLGSFGISMGGITSVIVAAVEPRLQAHVVAMAGGSIPDVLMSSKDSLLTKPLARYLRENRMDRREFERRLRAALRTDPLLLAPYVDRERALLFVTLLDRTIGRKNALRLRGALGRPKTIFLPLGHYTALVAVPVVKRESLRFFRWHLEGVSYNRSSPWP